MDTLSYWQKLDKKPDYPKLDLERPEQKQLAGRLVIIGGSKSQFFSVASATTKAKALGVGQVTAILPDALKNKIPTNEELIFASSESSGAFARSAKTTLQASLEASDYSLFIGDLGKNSETALVINELIQSSSTPCLLTRDSVDLIAPDGAQWIEREALTLLLSLPQFQNLCRSIYYPRIITLSMPTNQLVETLHKFTLSYPSIIITYHNNQIIAAKNGQVISVELSHTPYSPISLWSGELATNIASFQLWNKNYPFEAAISAFWG